MSLKQCDFRVSKTCEIAESMNVDIEAIEPFLRVLLTTDGTVTKSLEAYFWEPIAVELVQQSETLLEDKVELIECKKGDRVLSRQVQLRGQDSDKVYVLAESLIRMELLPERFQQDLIAQRLGIGELVRECGLETYREIVRIGEDRQLNQVWRTYRILMDHKPVIQITEHFPRAMYVSAVS